MELVILLFQTSRTIDIGLGIFPSHRLYNNVIRTPKYFEGLSILYELINIFNDKHCVQRHGSSFNNEYVTHFQLILKKNTETDL